MNLRFNLGRYCHHSGMRYVPRSTKLTGRYTQAVEFARAAHTGQLTRGSNTPHLAHLLGVSSLVLDYGGSEDQAIVGLLHHAAEDDGIKREAIRRKFGDAVADMIAACTNGTVEGEAAHDDGESRRRNWRKRKLAHLAKLTDEPDSALLVSACDKLHSARGIVSALRNPVVGDQVFERLTGGKLGTLAYYNSLVSLLSRRGCEVGQELDIAVSSMHDLAGVANRVDLSEHVALW